MYLYKKASLQTHLHVIPFKKQLFIYLTKIIPDYQEKATFYFNSSKNTLPQSVKYTLYKTPIAINNRKQASNVIPPAPSPGKTKQNKTKSHPVLIKSSKEVSSITEWQFHYLQIASGYISSMISLTCSILPHRQAFSPQNSSALSTSPSAARVSALVIQ